MTREEFFRQRLAAYKPGKEATPWCSCCLLMTCDYDKNCAKTLSDEFGVHVPIQYVQSAEYWRDQQLWEHIAKQGI